MNNVNKTLYIPLYGKAMVSKKGVILEDKMAEKIWEEQKIPLKGRSKSKWLAYFMGMRSAVFDNWLKDKLTNYNNCIILHLGCGLDSRVLRVQSDLPWYDVDFPAVIEQRKKYYKQSINYHMLGADIKDSTFVNKLPKSERAIVVLEGVSMYLTNEELRQILFNLKKHFEHLSVLLDCYTPFGAKMSKVKNPIKDVGVKNVYGIKKPEILEEQTGLDFVKEHEITPKHLIGQLKGVEKFMFKTIYAGKTSKKIYKLYEYEN